MDRVVKGARAGLHPPLRRRLRTVSASAAPADHPPDGALFDAELRVRAAGVRLVLTDVDGVLTDGGVYYSEQGEVLKRFSVRDGMGVERLRADGIETAFLTREASAIVARRAEKLALRLCYLGVPDKRAVLPRVLEEAGVDLTQVAYIGDDFNDAEIMAAVAERGLVGAPRDAQPAILRLAHHVCAQPGGHDAFRDFAEWILSLRNEARVARSLNKEGGP
jgi:3-deoxy-D-manno-octulosonate 8-phosphate phosphatase (KDO 8-P phosphatase)